MLCLVLVGILGTGAVHAASYTESWSGTNLTGVFSGSVPKFNTALGTLTSATLTFTNSSWASVELTNPTANPINWSASMTWNMVFNPVQGWGPTTVTNADTKTGALAGDWATVVINTTQVPAPTASHVYSLPVDLSFFTGPGSFGIGGNAGDPPSFIVAPGEEVLYVDGPKLYGQGSAVVRYEYSSVPEPASFLALGAGLIGLAGMIRRHRS